MNNEAYTIKLNLLKKYFTNNFSVFKTLLPQKHTHTHTHKMFTYSSDFFTIFFGPTVYWGIKSLAGRTVIHNVCVARTFDISLVPNFVSLILIGPSDYLWEPIRSGYTYQEPFLTRIFFSLSFWWRFQNETTQKLYSTITYHGKLFSSKLVKFPVFT